MNESYEIIKLICANDEEEKKVRERFEDGDILTIKIHKNFLYYEWN